MSKLSDAFGSAIVNGKEYTYVGLLGWSTTAARLARSTEGNLVVVKTSFQELHEMNYEEHAALAYYEAMATMFYTEHGVAVPRTIDIEVRPERIIVVKEYIEGLTYEDITIRPDISDRDRETLLADYNETILKDISENVFGVTEYFAKVIGTVKAIKYTESALKSSYANLVINPEMTSL